MFHDTIEVLYEIDLEKIQTLEDMQKVFPVFLAQYNKTFSEEEAKGFKDVCIESDKDYIAHILEKMNRMIYDSMLYGGYSMGGDSNGR